MNSPKWLVNNRYVAAYLARVRDPILADRSLDLMAAAFWGCLSIWGIASAITGLGTIDDAIGDIFGKVWGGSVGVLCTIAFAAAISTFFKNESIARRIKLKKTEMLWGSVAGGFISMYPMYLAVAFFGGDLGRFAPFWASLVYLAIPTWRVRHLYHRIAKLRQIAEDEARMQASEARLEGES